LQIQEILFGSQSVCIGFSGSGFGLQPAFLGSKVQASFELLLEFKNRLVPGFYRGGNSEALSSNTKLPSRQFPLRLSEVVVADVFDPIPCPLIVRIQVERRPVEGQGIVARWFDPLVVIESVGRFRQKLFNLLSPLPFLLQACSFCSLLGTDPFLLLGEALLLDLFDLLLHSRNWLSSLFDHGQRR
jgi:hypothetical protein